MNVYAMNIDGENISPKENDASPPSLEATLNLLSTVGTGNPVSQRSLAGRLGVALGLANALIKRCVHKGFIKVGSAPARRYAYYLTPAGFAEKSRLVGEYIETSLSFFRSSRMEYQNLIADAARIGHRRAVLAGSGELAEIAMLAAEDAGVELVGVIDASRNVPNFHRLPVYRDIGECPAFDVLIVAEPRSAQQLYDGLARQTGAARILVPPMLHVSREPVVGTP